MDIKETYKQLTGIDIENQKQLWDDRGKGYYGEFLVFCELYRHIKGNCKILMNLEIPVSNQKNTEIDLIMIHETGLYVFEIKHYKGTIYGKDTDKTWTQYFRTSKNNCFKNPIIQNNYHIDALKNMFSDLPIYSVVVFTSDDCSLKVSNENHNVDICSLDSIEIVLSHRFNNHSKILNAEKIDNIFGSLVEFSKMQTPVEIECEIKPFFSWVQPSIDSLEKAQKDLIAEKESVENTILALKKQKKKNLVFCFSFAILCVVISCIFLFAIKSDFNFKIEETNAELAKFKQNFLHIDEIDNEYIDALDSYVDVSNVELSPLTDDAVSFSAELSMLNEVYWVRLQKNAKYIVMTTSGKIYEYDVFGEHLKYDLWLNTLGKHYRMSRSLSPVQFYGIPNPSDISYIKLVNIELSKVGSNKAIIKDKLELELYSAQ